MKWIKRQPPCLPLCFQVVLLVPVSCWRPRDHFFFASDCQPPTSGDKNTTLYIHIMETWKQRNISRLPAGEISCPVADKFVYRGGCKGWWCKYSTAITSRSQHLLHNETVTQKIQKLSIASLKAGIGVLFPLVNFSLQAQHLCGPWTNAIWLNQASAHSHHDFALPPPKSTIFSVIVK